MSGMIVLYFTFLKTQVNVSLMFVKSLPLSNREAVLIVGTFGLEGPDKCSGLEVIRYDADSLHAEFGSRFRLVESSKELHRTPFGTSRSSMSACCPKPQKQAANRVEEHRRGSSPASESNPSHHERDFSFCNDMHGGIWYARQHLEGPGGCAAGLNRCPGVVRLCLS
jgi:hypothetical protein